jgi:hypothetical protein
MRLESSSLNRHPCLYMEDRVVPHGRREAPHAHHVATSISMVRSISYAQHRFSEIALRAQAALTEDFDP